MGSLYLNNLTDEQRAELERKLHAAQRNDRGEGCCFICQKIIEQHGGRMWVDAHAGPGATFKLTLPAAAQPAPEQPQGAIQP